MMTRKDLLFDSPIGIVKIWNPERQFELESRHLPLPVQLKAVVVQRAPGIEDQVGDVVYVKSYELRLRGFHHEEKVTGKEISDLEREADSIRRKLFRGVIENRGPLLFQYAWNLHKRGLNRAVALEKVLHIAAICNPPFPEKSAHELFSEAWEKPEVKETEGVNKPRIGREEASREDWRRVKLPWIETDQEGEFYLVERTYYYNRQRVIDRLRQAIMDGVDLIQGAECEKLASDLIDIIFQMGRQAEERKAPDSEDKVSTNALLDAVRRIARGSDTVVKDLVQAALEQWEKDHGEE